MIGAYVGKAAGELVDPTVEEAYWREQHPLQNEGVSTTFQDYSQAYRTGYEGYRAYGTAGRSFADAEAELRAGYEATGAAVPWDRARPAAEAAWNRVHRRATQPPAEGPGLAEAATSEDLRAVR